MNKQVKKRHWAFVVYPESAPADWVEQLTATGLQCAISPLHNKDQDPTGEAKKPHWHVIACYSGPTSYNVVKKLTEQFNAPAPQALEQVKGYYRYLTHKDNPEKAQYSEHDIKTLNGFNILDFSDLSRGEVAKLKIEIQQMILNLNLIEYSDLMDYLLENLLYSHHDVASSNTIFFNTYIASRRNKSAREYLNRD